jgi:AraC-like DNA-binding protein
MGPFGDVAATGAESPDPASVWATALGNAAQVAVGLATAPSRTFLRAALERLVAIEAAGPFPAAPGPRDADAAALARHHLATVVRTYALELARGLRLAQPRLPAAAAREIDALCVRLEATTRLTPPVFQAARQALAALDAPAPDEAAFAWRVRRHLESLAPARVPIAQIAAHFGERPWWVQRSFKRTHGVSLGTFYQQLCDRITVEVVQRPRDLKLLVDEVGCSERTLRRRFVRVTGRPPRRSRGGA